jgi:hypothetical protein
MVAYSAGIMIAETRKSNAPKGRRFVLGLLGGLLPLFAVIATSVLADWISPSERIGAAVVFLAAPLIVIGQLWLTKQASGGRRKRNSQLIQSIVAILAFVCFFAMEFVTVGFGIYGQLGVLVVPFFVGNARSWKGVSRPERPVLAATVAK